MPKIIRVVSDNDFATLETVIWGKSNILWLQTLRLFARKNVVKTICKFTMSVRNYDDARNNIYLVRDYLLGTLRVGRGARVTREKELGYFSQTIY